MLRQKLDAESPASTSVTLSRREQICLRPIQKAILNHVRRGCRSESEVVMWVLVSIPSVPYSAKFIRSEIEMLIRQALIEIVPGWGLRCA
jgi:hypothetical protein